MPLPSASSRKTVISVVGATATGKTALAISLAQYLNTSILSCDSRQCYKELSVITAKPKIAAQQGIKHYFIDSHSIHQAITVKDYITYAQSTLKQLFEKHTMVILVGGSGLFWTALRYGLDDIPPTPTALRQSIQNAYTQKGLDWLKSTLATEDKLYFQTGESANPQRMMRALEVIRHTKKSIKMWQTGNNKIVLPYRMIDIGLRFEDAEKRKLIISQRTRSMLAQGLEQEVNSLRKYASLNALQTVGFKEWLSYPVDEVDYQQVEADIIKNTTYYAKRQMTWFKRYDTIKWFNTDVAHQQIIHYLKI